MPGLGSDRFELVRPAGEGSYGVVYEACDRLSGGRVAIKVLFDTDPTAAERFDREVSLLADLHHPSIVHYIAHGTSEAGQRYLVMEWLEGQTLRQRLEWGPLPVADVLSLARRVLMGLTFAEHKGIVHRDIKPANLFLVNGSPGAAKILDFGIAQRTSDTKRLTATGLMIGTPTYMSPEQARADGSLDARSDVFSLGSVLYECLCGGVPFDAPQAMATLAKICFEEPTRLEARLPELSSALAGLVHAMLQKKREERPSPSAVIEALGGIAADGEVRHSSTMRGSIHRRGRGSDQRILAAVFVGAVERLPPALAEELTQVIARYGGRAERLLDGSRILLPAQHLGASEQAVVAAQCALAVNQMLGRRAPIVICTGRALVGEQQALGELFERGATLLASAEPGHVRVDEASAALLDARFEVAGDERSGRTLQRERAGGEAPRTVLGQTTAFVGRERELTQLRLIFQECREEQVARAVLVMAPAGGGKSRLRHEWVERLHEADEPCTLLSARGDSVHGGTQFSVVAPAILAWAEIASNDPDALKRSKLSQRVSALLPATRASSVAAFLGEMTGVHFPDGASQELRTARSAPQLMADHMLASWLEWLDVLSAATPVLICVEDLHWSDPASLRFLDAALRNSKRALLVLAFARPEVRELFPSLWAERDLTEIRLPKLNARACGRLLDALEGISLSASERASMIERADGNPFFLEELLRALQARKTGELLPDTILGIVQARLDALGEEPKQLVRAASVFGLAFRVEGARALFGAEAENFDFHRWLGVLCEREVIFPRGLPSEQEYVFRHAMIRDAAYVLLAAEDRVLGHQLAAAWLEKTADEPALLADHYERAGDRAGAARSYARAAAQAFDAGSLDDVLRFGERAVACGVQGEPLGKLAALLAEARSYLEDNAGAAAWAERARDCLEPGSPAWWRATQVGAVAHLRLGDPEFEMLAMHVLANYEPDSLMPEQALAVAYLTSESLRLMRDDLAGALLALLPAELPESLRGRPEGCLAAAHAIKAYRVGNLSAALRHAREALSAQRHAGSLRDIADSLGLCGYFLHELGVYDEAEVCLLEQVQLGQRIGSQRDVSYGRLNLGSIYARRGLLEQAERTLHEACKDYEAMGSASYQAEALGHLIGARSVRGDLDGAAEAAARARSLTALDPSAEAYVLARTSSLALLRGDVAEALALSTRAHALVLTHGLSEYVVQIQLAHIAALEATRDLGAQQLALQEALRWLAAQADKIDDSALRLSFLDQVAEHARLRTLAGAGSTSPASST